ncbi:hypothetical protein [Flavobacterium sp. NRK1]|uniref:hypothetical protein n=1 Tax=Flavobacterium sp. NRK1 TaxID=2954929 RepID=UPI002092EAC4|nr:hypothetical protein [Flavobacterium sp. NRK1]MCO6147477.1 hypothetical protein [Flavobacterium sp. NRK1]
MKTILLIITLFTGLISSAQTKEQLIDYIIKENRVDSKHISSGGIQSPIYISYEKLIKLVTNNELLDLAKNKNAALRMYAIQGLIQRKIGDIPALFKKELESGDTVETMMGCNMGTDFTAFIVYKFQIYSEEEQPESQLNNIILNTNSFVWWLMYDWVFENNLDENFLPRIEELAFEKKNSFAFMYLKNNYGRYGSRIDDYLLNVFPKQKFVKDEENNNDGVFLCNFIEILLESGRADYKTVAVAKLRENQWLKERDGWYNEILKKYNIIVN